MLESALCRFHEAAWERKRLGLSKKQVADEEVEQLGLIHQARSHQERQRQSASVTAIPPA